VHKTVHLKRGMFRVRIGYVYGTCACSPGTRRQQTSPLPARPPPRRPPPPLRRRPVPAPRRARWPLGLRRPRCLQQTWPHRRLRRPQSLRGQAVPVSGRRLALQCIGSRTACARLQQQAIQTGSKETAPDLIHKEVPHPRRPHGRCRWHRPPRAPAPAARGAARAAARQPARRAGAAARRAARSAWPGARAAGRPGWSGARPSAPGTAPARLRGQADRAGACANP